MRIGKRKNKRNSMNDKLDQRENKAKMLGEGDVSKILIKFAIPAILAILVNSIYNIVDTIFVGILNDTSAIGGVTVVFPIMTLISAVGQMFGVGAGAYISRLLGAKRKDDADTVSSTIFFTCILIGIIMTVFGLIFIEPILGLFGATETIMPYAIDYGFVIISGSVITVSLMTLVSFTRAEGNASLGMLVISLGAIINMIGDPIFMFVFGLGIFGSALSTVFSQIISLIIILAYFFKGKSYLQLTIKKIKFKKEIFINTMKIGIPTFISQALASFALGFVNMAASPYGDAVVASIGVSMRIITIAVNSMIGFNQGLQPLAGFNYGAKKFKRLFEAIKVSTKWTTVIGVLTAITLLLFAENIIACFTQDPEVIDIGSKALRAMSIFLPLYGFQVVFRSLYQGIGRGLESLLLSTSRQGLFLIPVVLIVPRLFDLNGVIYAQTVADAFSFVLGIILSYMAIKRLNREWDINKNKEPISSHK